ncbi:MAG: acyl-[acyl-carrier-protein] thioesterase [Treponema sp.]|nr:acyl-[acyl-carrier-protein] thioesterase [Treponema sp.]
MTDFKLWHEDDKNTFHNKTMVYFSQCTKNGKLSLNELLRLTSDTAVEDYRQRGLSREFLMEHGYYILVSRCAFRIFRLPSENQNIEITTWEEKPDPLQLYRGYTIKDESGKTLVNGYSTWLVVDCNARKIVPAKNFTLRKPFDFRTDNDCPKPGKIVIPQERTLLSERIIGYSDIDANGHTNNSRYGAFLLDALPEQYQEKNFTDFKINYSKEAMYGQKLKVSGSFDDAQKKILIIGETESGTSFESELLYS